MSNSNLASNFKLACRVHWLNLCSLLISWKPCSSPWQWRRDLVGGTQVNGFYPSLIQFSLWPPGFLCPALPPWWNVAFRLKTLALTSHVWNRRNRSSVGNTCCNLLWFSQLIDRLDSDDVVFWSSGDYVAWQAHQLSLHISGGRLCALPWPSLVNIFQSLSSDLYHLELLLITAWSITKNIVT